MTPIRHTVMAMMACAAGLSLTACSAGITTVSPSPSAARTVSTSSAARSSAATSSAATSSAATSPSPSASPADTIDVDSPLRTFPVPHGAQVISNITCDNETIIQLGSIPVPKASSFYNSVLPENGYKITGNTLINTTGDGLTGPAAEIEFTGHGYKGTIAALSNLGSEMASAGISPSGMPTDLTGNLITIDLAPPRATGCPTATPAG